MCMKSLGDRIKMQMLIQQDWNGAWDKELQDEAYAASPQDHVLHTWELNTLSSMTLLKIMKINLKQTPIPTSFNFYGFMRLIWGRDCY